MASKASGRKWKKEQSRVAELLKRLDQEYPDVTCALHHETPFQLLAATILSAQCTDERVNKVTPALFKAYPAPKSLAKASQEDVEEIIRSTGFFRNKARSLIGAATRIESDFGGEVPQTMEEILTLPGVARKTANVVLGTAYGISSGVVVDTHVSRLSQRLGLTQAKDPRRIEQDLLGQLPREKWIEFSHQLIHHGRRICKARTPRCSQCVLADLCPYFHRLRSGGSN